MPNHRAKRVQTSPQRVDIIETIESKWQRYYGLTMTTLEMHVSADRGSLVVQSVSDRDPLTPIVHTWPLGVLTHFLTFRQQLWLGAL